jgi:hypothetical protein
MEPCMPRHSKDVAFNPCWVHLASRLTVSLQQQKL